MILLDTHAWFWLGAQPERLSPRAAAAIKGSMAAGGLAIASISLMEVATMIARGRVQPLGTPEGALRELLELTAVVVKDITPAIATLAAQLPADFPGDPADRLITATARVESLVLVTRDPRLRASPIITTVW